MIRILTIITTSLFLASCGGSDSAEPDGVGSDPRINEVQDDLNAARQIWQDQGLIDYSFYYSPRIDRACLPDGVVPDPAPPWLVTVEDNEVISVRNTSTDEPKQLPYEEYFGTINDIFEYLEQQLAEAPQVVALSFTAQNELPTFDDSFGYPKQIYFEFNDDNECSSREIIIGNFR
ncbi:DUF6174 domain-containing protein [Idiomarina ramblicola]|uniref:Lipoprotein n=1 Tax=Idiomarina ramblicola TaxID=263724 RepID=A0A432YZX1_9GAMM|nr:DUF6174 domain-containing protein [Idiomarina ramblicola]RUO69480.1 hypothetical protein CWI78_06055 [Idiomarina ramblicola]